MMLIHIYYHKHIIINLISIQNILRQIKKNQQIK